MIQQMLAICSQAKVAPVVPEGPSVHPGSPAGSEDNYSLPAAPTPQPSQRWTLSPGGVGGSSEKQLFHYRGSEEHI